jgi:hypothetical protein
MEHLLQRGTRRMNREINYEQRDGDSEHAIAESIYPALAPRSASARRAWVSWHDIVCFASAGQDAC